MPTASELLGVPVPSDAPAFLLALGAHVAAGLSGVIAGSVAAVTKKAAGAHTRAGLIYWWALAWVLISSTVMAALRWPHDIHLAVIGVIAFGAGTLGFVVRLRRQPGWRQRHILMMGASFIALLTGFYVDNGPHLPGWRHLPPWSFWILPAGIGIPLIVRAVYRDEHRTPPQPSKLPRG